jgi:nucleotide-binding universal stress UspA family protein
MRTGHRCDAVTPAEILARPRVSRDQQPDTTLPPVFLVPVNDSRSSEAALRLARLLAAPSGAKLVVVRTVPAMRHTMTSRGSDDTSRIGQRDRAPRGLRRPTSPRRRAKTEHELVVAVDAGADRKIAELPGAYGAALIIMGPSSEDMRRRLFGGIVERTRRQAACPVVTIGGRGPGAGEASGH